MYVVENIIQKIFFKKDFLRTAKSVLFDLTLLLKGFF